MGISIVVNGHASGIDFAICERKQLPVTWRIQPSITIQATGQKSHMLPLLRTCRTLHQAGMPFLFHGGVQIDSVERAMSFCQFMLADRTRFRYLRRIDVSFGDEVPDDRGLDCALSQLFRHAQRLEELCLDHSEFLDRYPATAEAVTELTALKTLSVIGGSCRDHTNMRDMFCTFVRA